MKIYHPIFVFLVAFSLVSCQPKETETNSENKVEVSQEISEISLLYFHGDRRCPTCISVGEVAEQTYFENFSDNNKVQFLEINIDLQENEAIAEKYEIAGSALLLDIHGKVEDITSFAFQNAKSNPELLKNKIIELVKSGLKK